MSREIKFRQPIFNLDGTFREWHYWGYMHGDIVNWADFKQYGASKITDPKDSLQYIGKKDIYEGDILGELDDPNCFLIVWDEDHARFGYILQNNGNSGVGEITNDFLENEKVIGNIIQNPELLNQQ